MARVGARRLSPAVRGLPFGLVVAGTALVGVATALAAVRLPATPGEARLVEAAVAVVGPARAAPVTVGLDQLAARVQLSTYAELTGAFPRHATALAGARELALLACAGILLALLALVRSLGVRPQAALLVLSVLAVCPPAVAALARFGPGLLGVMWLTVGAALLARLRPGLRMIGLPAVAVGVVSAPVLAVPLLVIAAALLVAERAQRAPLLLALAVPVSVAPLVLLMPPAGGAAVPALVVVTVLGAFVLVDEVVTRLGTALAQDPRQGARRGRRRRRRRGRARAPARPGRTQPGAPGRPGRTRTGRPVRLGDRARRPGHRAWPPDRLSSAPCWRTTRTCAPRTACACSCGPARSTTARSPCWSRSPRVAR